MGVAQGGFDASVLARFQPTRQGRGLGGGSPPSPQLALSQMSSPPRRRSSLLQLPPSPASASPPLFAPPAPCLVGLVKSGGQGRLGGGGGGAVGDWGVDLPGILRQLGAGLEGVPPLERAVGSLVAQVSCAPPPPSSPAFNPPRRAGVKGADHPTVLPSTDNVSLAVFRISVPSCPLELRTSHSPSLLPSYRPTFLHFYLPSSLPPHHPTFP